MLLLRPLQRIPSLQKFPPRYHPSYQPVPRSLRNLRSFHSTRPNQFIEPVLGQIHDLLVGFHTFTGMSWAATIPLSALFIRLCIAEPLHYASYKASQRRLDTLPLVAAWRQVITHQVMQKVGHLGPQRCQREILIGVRSKRLELYKRWKCQTWKNFLPLTTFPAWLAMIETLRRMCGARPGLLGMGSDLLGGTSVEMDPGKALDALKSSAVPLEPSLAQEGALWFPDLLAPDPLLILPFILSGTLFASLHLTSRSQAREGRQPSFVVKSFEAVLKILALAIGPVMINLPSTLLLYWISSSVIALVSKFLTDRLLPFRRPPEPCKPRKNDIEALLSKRYGRR